jgi:hypothetical protein
MRVSIDRVDDCYPVLLPAACRVCVIVYDVPALYPVQLTDSMHKCILQVSGTCTVDGRMLYRLE